MPTSLVTRDDFTPRRNTDAATHFAKKMPLPSDAFATLSQEHKARAFRILTVNKLRLVNRAVELFKRAIERGDDYAVIQRELLAYFDSEKIARPPLHRLQLAFRQNVLQAYSVQRTQTLRDPDVIEQFPYWQYLTVGNGEPNVNNVRPTHAALHGQVFRADDPFWDHYDPPWEYNCRCFKVALTPGQVQAMRVPVRDFEYVRTKIKVPGQKQRGIAPNPDFDFARDAFDAAQFDLSRIEAELREAIEEVLRDANLGRCAQPSD